MKTNQVATWTPILSQVLAKYTWVKLAPQLIMKNHHGRRVSKRREITVAEVIAIQELRAVCKVFNNITTQWFLREWNHVNWAKLFERFSSARSHRNIADDYFRQLIETQIRFNHWGDMTGSSFFTRVKDTVIETYLFIYPDVYHLISDYDGWRHVIFINTSGKRLCSDRSWKLISLTSGFDHQIDNCFKCFDLQQSCNCYQTKQHLLCDSILTSVMPHFYGTF